MKVTELAYFTDDVAAMAAFYERLLGDQPVASSDSVAIFMAGETKIFIHKTYEPGPDELPPHNHVALMVPDVDIACDALVGRGLLLEVPAQDFYWGRSAYLRDPDGNLIEIIQATAD